MAKRMPRVLYVYLRVQTVGMYNIIHQRWLVYPTAIGTKTLKSTLRRALSIWSSFEVLLCFHALMYLEGLFRVDESA